MLATGDDRKRLLAGAVQGAAPVQALAAQAAQAAHGRTTHLGLVPPLTVDKVDTAHSPGLNTHSIQDEQRDPTSTFIASARHDAQPAAGQTAALSDEPFRALFESIDEGVATL